MRFSEQSQADSRLCSLLSSFSETEYYQGILQLNQSSAPIIFPNIIQSLLQVNQGIVKNIFSTLRMTTGETEAIEIANQLAQLVCLQVMECVKMESTRVTPRDILELWLAALSRWTDWYINVEIFGMIKAKLFSVTLFFFLLFQTLLIR